MKKLVLALGILLATSVAFAATDNKEIISATTLNTAIEITSDTINMQTYRELAFFVNYAEVETDGGVSADITLDVSYDGTNWVDLPFRYGTSGDTLINSITPTSDGWYYIWLDSEVVAPYIRMVITSNNTDADDYATVTANSVGLK